MAKFLSRTLLITLLGSVFSFSPAVYAACDVNDFVIGNPGVAADACFDGSGDVNDAGLEGAIESKVGGDWTIFGKFENDAGTDVVGDSLSVQVTQVYDNGFDWEITDSSVLGQDLTFVVKQSTSWIGYLAFDISATFGSFFTDTPTAFDSEDFSFLATFHKVPEINGASAGIAFSLMLSLIALVRERRRFRRR